MVRKTKQVITPGVPPYPSEQNQTSSNLNLGCSAIGESDRDEVRTSGRRPLDLSPKDLTPEGRCPSQSMTDDGLPSIGLTPGVPPYSTENDERPNSLTTEQPKVNSRGTTSIPHKEVEPKPKTSRKSKKQQTEPIVYTILNGTTTPVQTQKEIQPRRDVILTLQCTMEEVNQILEAGDMHWFGTTPDQVWENTRKQSTESTLLPSATPNTTTYHAYEPLSKIPAPVAPEMDYVYKLRNLKIHMYTNQAVTREIKSSACFWCTCPFTQETCHILKYGQTNEILGSGAYCSPECAVAGLFNHTKWDDSEKLESYQLMNYCYQLSEIDEKDNESMKKKRTSIQPAVSPFYFLDKFLGNMTPEEFREMNRGGKHLLYMLDKPLTRVLPEIHEEKDASSLLRITGSSKYRVKRQSEQVQTVTQADILRQQFKLGSG